jgi:hypothetical protein
VYLGEPREEQLAPGARKVYRVELDASSAPFLAKPGTYHLLLDGGVLKAGADSNRITVTVTP